MVSGRPRFSILSEPGSSPTFKPSGTIKIKAFESFESFESFKLPKDFEAFNGSRNRFIAIVLTFEYLCETILFYVTSTFTWNSRKVFMAVRRSSLPFVYTVKIIQMNVNPVIEKDRRTLLTILH